MSEFPPTPAPVKELDTEMTEEERYRLVLIDQSHDARDQARDLADIQLTEELNEGGWLKRTANGIWKGNLLKDYYRLKYTREHEAKIAESNDILQGESLPEAQTRLINALVSRFQSNEDELIHTDAGEKREVHTDDALSSGLKDIIRRFAVEKTLNENTLEQEKKKLLEEYGKQNPDADLSKSLVLTDNLLEVAQSIKGRFTHDEAMDQAITNMEIITGQARNGARTEAQYSKVDKLANSLSRTKLGSLVTPGALATGVALAASVAGIGTKGVVGAAAATAGLGTVAGVWAGLRENKRVKDERSQHAREMATGGGFNEGVEDGKDDKRRIEMEATRYESVSALDLAKELLDKTSTEVLEVGENQNEAVRAALEALARAQARIDLSDTKNIDLIHYSSKVDVGEERIKLDLARIESRRAIASALTPELRAELGLTEELGVKDIIAGHVELYKSEIETDISEKDKAFRALKRRRVARAAITGTVVGIAGGLVAQEAMAAIDPSRLGVFEALSGASAPINADGEVHQTILTSFVNGDETVEHIDASTTFDQHDSTAESFVKTGDDMEWNKNEDGTFTLVGPDGKAAVEDIVVNADGSMDQPTIERIEEAGLNVKDDTWVDPVETTVTKEISLDQYWQENAGEMQSTSIDTWYMNNSPNPDLNEIRMYRGGENGLVDGGFRFESGMTPDGSFVNGESVNPVEATQQGNLVWVVSKMGEDSGAMFTLPAGPDGSLTIMKDDPAGALFTDVNGRAELAQGYRLHAFYSEGVDVNGTLHGGSLATMVGEAEVATTTQTETVVNEVVHHEYTISSNGYNVAHDNITEVAPITPIVGRKSMETLKDVSPAVPEVAETLPWYYGGELSNTDVERIQSESSPRLQENPDRELNPKEELEWFHENLTERKGTEYVAALDAFVQNDPALRSMSPETSSIVTIPVGAASESENIYATLSLFAQQEAVSGGNKTILLNVNWLDTQMDDPEAVTAIQKTISEIERAKNDFPSLSIAVMQKEYIKEEVEATGGVIGYVANDLMDAALLAVQNKISNGEMADDHDVLIVRSDADVNGISRGQLRNLEKAASENRDLDIIKGVTRFGIADAEKFPGFGISTAFINMISIASSQENAMHTGGANFAVRASTMAAVGGLGKMYRNGKWFTGAGSDDTFVGRRIRAARQMGSSPNREEYYYSQGNDTSGASSTGDTSKRRIKVVSGASIDTNAQRLLPFYVEGTPIMRAWDEREGGFADGPGGHRDRAKDYEMVEAATKERANQEQVYEAIELNIGFELAQASERVAKKALGLFFAGVPGGYIVEGEYENPERPIKFKLTNEGRAFIKKRIERETNGRHFGPYGMRKMRQLYGKVKPGAKRQPAGARSPLVSPLT